MPRFAIKFLAEVYVDIEADSHRKARERAGQMADDLAYVRQEEGLRAIPVDSGSNYRVKGLTDTRPVRLGTVAVDSVKRER